MNGGGTNRVAGEDWYEDWFKRSPIGIDGTKFDPDDGALALGAGMTIGILPTGHPFAVKGTFLISIPGPTLMLTGRASVLQSPSKLTTGDPPFFALLLADVSTGELVIGVGADIVLAEVVQIQGDAVAFFDVNDPESWYLHLGEEPEDKRIRANFLEMLQANGFIELDGGGIRAGGSHHIGGMWTFGPVDVDAAIYLDGYAAIGFIPQQYYGELQAFAALGVSLAGTGLEIGASASATAKAEARDPNRFNLALDHGLQFVATSGNRPRRDARWLPL